jgi:uroporphyrinogen decarboxylase
VLDPPVRTAADVDRVRVPDPEETVPFVFETIRILRRELAGKVPLIGFGAAPFTLAAYLVEGGGSKNFDHVKRMLYADPAAAHTLLDKCSATLERYLAAQARAGAQAIQIFDTWAGLLAPEDYREFALRYARRVLDSLKGTGVPRIYFALDSAHLLDEIRECGADVVGLDWRTPLLDGARRLGPGFALQGNLDPCVLLATPAAIAERAGKIVADGATTPGHVFNLGHGILPETPVENARALIEAVQGAGARERAR